MFFFGMDEELDIETVGFLLDRLGRNGWKGGVWTPDGQALVSPEGKRVLLNRLMRLVSRINDLLEEWDVPRETIVVAVSEALLLVIEKSLFAEVLDGDH